METLGSIVGRYMDTRPCRLIVGFQQDEFLRPRAEHDVNLGSAACPLAKRDEGRRPRPTDDDEEALAPKPKRLPVRAADANGFAGGHGHETFGAISLSLDENPEQAGLAAPNRHRNLVHARDPDHHELTRLVDGQTRIAERERRVTRRLPDVLHDANRPGFVHAAGPNQGLINTYSRGCVVDGLAPLFEDARNTLTLRGARRLPVRPFRVTFRPYAGLHSVLYDRGDHYEARISDLLREAPTEVHRALATLLLGKLDRRTRVTKEDVAAYREWALSPEVSREHERSRSTRGRKSCLPPCGRIHDLGTLFEDLNRDYFHGSLARPRLGWSPRVSRRLYGHHDAAHNAIVINRMLDHERVPPFVVADILHHELLHIKHGVKIGDSGRRTIHPPEFKRDEARYHDHALAQAFLRRLERGGIRLHRARTAGRGFRRTLDAFFHANA